MKTLVIIPSRLSASRLPGKPLLKINGLSIISHVFKKAEQANIGEVVVATENNEILEDVEKNGGRGILTRSDHKTGTDRIFEAYKKLDFKNNVIHLIRTNWSNPNNQTIKPYELFDLYRESLFVPIGRGNISLDCFRIYEAIVAGAIPVMCGTNQEIEMTFNFYKK